MNRVMAALALVAGLGPGCGAAGSGGGTAPSNQALTGKIGGKSWTFHTAQSDSFLSDDVSFSIDAYADVFTPCAGAGPVGSDQLILTVPKTVGTHQLSLDLNETFYVAATSANFVATSGTIVVDSVTATTITGSVKFAYNADNSVDGAFEATICQ